MPYYGSTLFGGIGAALLSDGTTTDVQVMENVAANSSAIVCTSFQHATGSTWKLHACAEMWQTSNTSVGARLGLSQSAITFFSRPPAVPVFDGSLLQTEYSLSTKLTHFNVEAFAKLCVPGTHIWGAVMIRGDVTLHTRSELRESILSPSGYVFKGTTARVLSNADGAGVRTLTVNPVISVGIDIAYSRGVYASPSLYVGLPFMGLAEWASWKTSSVGLQCSLQFSLTDNPRTTSP
jgi:hypothetical protein